MFLFEALLVAATALSTAVHALPQITRKGRYLYK